jgi:hypothetical protein
MKSVENGWYLTPSLALTARLATRYTTYLLTVPGIFMGIAGLAGAVYVLSGQRRNAYWAALAGLVGAAWLFNVIAPASEEQRKVIMIVPPLFVLAAAGAAGLAHRLSPHWPRLTAGVLFGALAVLSLTTSFPLRAKPRLGFDRVAADLAGTMPPESAALVVSDSLGEGAFISEFALRKPDPVVYLMRGSKLLASQTWNQANYSSRVHSGEECARLLASVPISFLVVDRRKALLREPYFDSVDSMLRAHCADWKLVKAYPTPDDSPTAIAVYRRTAGAEPVRGLPEWIAPQFPGIR